MHIGQIVPDVTVTAGREVTSGHASTRLRALIPSRALIGRGHSVSIFPDDRLAADLASGRLFDPEVVVVHKARLDLSDALRALKARGVPIVLDVCDHVIALPHLRERYAALLPLADVVTTPTEVLARVLEPHVECQIRVIPDAVEGRRGEPRYEPVPRDAVIRLLWFGRSQNLGPLIERLPLLTPASIGRRVTLEVVTNDGPSAELLRGRVPDALSVQLISWSADALEQALARSDLVLLPTDDDPTRQVKSANRLERALWAGRLPVAMPSPVTDSYSKSAVVAPDLGEGVRRAIACRSTWADRIRAGQALVETTRTGPALAPLWEEVVRI